MSRRFPPPIRPLTAAILLTLLTPTFSTAQTAMQAYRIEPGPLAAVLARFAEASKLTLDIDPALVRGLTSNGLQGGATIPAGSAAVLAGTGLEAVADAPGRYTLRRAAPELQLPQVQVNASGPIEGRESYRPLPDYSTLRSTAVPLDVPQVVNVVPAQVLRDQRPRNMDDALVNVSGITQGNTLAGTQDTIMKRGFGGNRDGSIMHNGMPLVQGRGFNAAADSVEVLKGPSTLLYGIMDPGGVINVVSKRPQLERRTVVGASLSGYAGGKWGAGQTLDTTGPIGTHGIAYRLVLDRVDEDYWRNFGQHRESLVAPSIGWYGDATQVQFTYEFRKFLTPFDRGTALDPRNMLPLNIPATRRLDEPGNEMKGESHLAQFTLDHEFGRGWKGHVGLGYNRETYDAGQLRVSGVNPVTGVLSRSNDGTKGALSTDSYGMAYVDGHLATGPLRHDLQFGMDAEYRLIYRRDLLRQATTSTFNYLDPVYGRERASTTVSASDSDQTDKLRDSSFFAQDAIHLGPKWIAVVGLRWQAWQQTAGRGRPFATNTATDDSKWLPRGGLVYKVNDVTSVYASYTQSLKPSTTIAPLSSGTVITSGIQPEQGRSWELGAKWDVPGGVTATAALYDIDKKNVLVSQFNDVTKLTDWRTSGAARSRGLEWDASGRIFGRWQAIASYAYTDAKTTQDPLYTGRQLWNVARNTAALSTVYEAGEVGPGRLRLGAGLHHVGRRPGDSANSFFLPSYTTADVFAAYDLRLGGRKVHTQLNVKNLFNRINYPSSVNQYFVALGDVRQAILSASVEF